MEREGLTGLQKLVIICCAIAVLAAVNVFSGKEILRGRQSIVSAFGTGGSGKERKNPPRKGQSCEMQPAVNIKPVGSPQAKVKLKAFVQSTNSCHKPMVDLLRKVVQAFPNHLYLEFVDTATDAGSKASQKANINCAAALMINGKCEFEVEIKGKKQKVAFNHGPIDMMPPEFLAACLTQQLRKEYGATVTQAELTKLSGIITSTVKQTGAQESESAPKRPQIPNPALQEEP